MIIATVLRSGGEYTPEHVQWLHRQLPEGVRCVCFSDTDIPGIETIPLQYNWPGWWAKLELFRPDIAEDIFYIDLDTVIVGDITDLLECQVPMMLSDFYAPRQLASGLMFIPHSAKEKVLTTFLEDPDGHMRRCNHFACLGDQGFISPLLPETVTWQSRFPGRIVSYKVHVKHKGQLPEGVSICCFHGKPRPWDVNHSWIPPLSE